MTQPPPQALRFSHGRGERKTRVTGEEPQGTMGMVQTAGEARCLRPAFLCTRIFIERETSGYEAGNDLRIYLNCSNIHVTYRKIPKISPSMYKPIQI